MKKSKYVLSTLGHTWILDLDGTMIKHNGYKIDGKDSFLSGALDFCQSIPQKDMIIFITSRDEKYKKGTEEFLLQNGIHYNYIIYGAPYGERILINDDKMSGLHMAYGICVERDEGINIRFSYSEEV